MKMKKQGDYELVFKSNPFFTWIFGTIFIASGLAIIIFFGTVTIFVCQRDGEDSNVCNYEEIGLLGSQTKKIPLEQVKEAKVGIYTDDDNSKTYRVEILTDLETLPFPSYYSSDYESKKTFSDQINTFITNPEVNEISITNDERFFYYIFGGIFIGLGLMVVFVFGKFVTCRFDKIIGTMTLSRRGLFGTKVIKHYLSEIKRSSFRNLAVEWQRTNISNCPRIG
jgi:hypothetical protein